MNNIIYIKINNNNKKNNPTNLQYYISHLCFKQKTQTCKIKN